MRFKIFEHKEKQEVLSKLKKQFGVKTIPGIILKRGTERIFLFTGEITKKEFQELEDQIPIERVGMYFAKEIREKIRLSLDGAQLLKKQITKNIFELNDEQKQEWVLGRELLLKNKTNEFLIMRHNGNILGTGKASKEKISNYLPKSRRIKIKHAIN